jgi:flagellar M-ring protein FliF
VTDLVEQTLMQQLLAFTKEDLIRFAELGVISLLTLIVLMVVVRPLLKQVLASDVTIRPIPAFMREGAALIQSDATGNPAGAIEATDAQALTVGEGPSERMLDVAQIKGQLKAQSVERIGALVAQNPSDSVAVLRGWIHERAAA